MKKNNLETRTMTVFAEGQLYRNILAPKNLSKTIVVSNEVLPTLGEEKIDFKNSILKPFKNLFGKAAEITKNSCHPELVSGSHENYAKEEILKSVQSISKRNDPCFRMTQSLTLTRSLTLTERKAAFTLAETMIVLVVLGVVAAITVPALVNRHVEAERRTKLKKAMSVYDTALNKMVIENGIKSDTALSDWADSNTKNDCTNTSAYFKAARTLEVNGNATNCKFRASDGVFWDISDIQKPLIALREEDLNEATVQSDTNRAFHMYGWFDEQGSLRSNDLGKIDADNKADLEKLYDFLAGKTKTSMGGIANGGGTQEEPEPTPSRDPRLEGYDETCMPELNCSEYNCLYGGSVSGGTTTSASSSNIGQTECINQRKEVFKKYISTCEGRGYLFCTDYYCRCACLPYNTLITLADGSTKAVQDIDFNDELKVWDFDNGCLASAKPLWIQEEEIADKYNLLTFSDGRTLKTINQHRIFNKEAGKYTYPMTDETPLGTTTLLDDGSEVTLVKKEIIERPVKYYNIITEYHFNLFANGISTSNRFNNMYPIKDLKYVKDDRKMTPYEEFEGIPYEWYEKLRLAEQPLEINKDNDIKFNNSLKSYVIRLINTNKRQMANV